MKKFLVVGMFLTSAVNLGAMSADQKSGEEKGRIQDILLKLQTKLREERFLAPEDLGSCLLFDFFYLQFDLALQKGNLSCYKRFELSNLWEIGILDDEVYNQEIRRRKELRRKGETVVLTPKKSIHDVEWMKELFSFVKKVTKSFNRPKAVFDGQAL